MENRIFVIGDHPEARDEVPHVESRRAKLASIPKWRRGRKSATPKPSLTPC
jgi:hypothetical protein